MEEILKTVILKLSNPDDVERFHKFQKLVAVENITVTEMLMILIEKYNTDDEYSNVVLLYETELLDKIKYTDIQVGRSALRKYRDLGVLKDEDGPFWYTNSSNVIVYHWDKMKKFLTERSKNRYTKLIPHDC